jgi:succinoglycan biosynthesis protein ExoA
MPPAARDFVTICMPALNEERYIAAAIASVLPADDDIDYELLVLDGGSTDHTRAIVETLAARNGKIRLVANERRLQAAALNLAARVADQRSTVLIRADCHSRYPRGFAAGCLATLRAEKCASVVVSMRTMGRSCMQRAIASAQNSVLGNGGSAHRRETRSRFVDHGHHAAFDRGTFLRLGGYDEAFASNEDAELDLRLARAGDRIYLDERLAIDYFPRDTLRGLARQYRKYGWGRASTLLKHGQRPKLRQVAPAIVFATCITSLAAAVVDPHALIVPVAYAGLCLGWGLYRAAATRSPCEALAGPAAMVMHMSWGAGFIFRLLCAPLNRGRRAWRMSPASS